MGDLVTTQVLDEEGTGNPENGPGMNMSGFSGESGSTPGFFSRSQRIFIPSPCPPTNLSRSSGGTATFSIFPLERSIFKYYAVISWFPAHFIPPKSAVPYQFLASSAAIFSGPRP